MDKKFVSLLSTRHNPVMVEVPSYKDEVRGRPKVVMEYSNTMLDIIDRLIESDGVVNEKKGRSGVLPSPLRLTERHFLEMIPPTDKK
ncbi:piggyBac transposable element-derived protein 4 [Trichonephila clavipes]|nr:piggyBac transposable element-derived protein 4 [Trichonephila clavipes]